MFVSSNTLPLKYLVSKTADSIKLLTTFLFAVNRLHLRFVFRWTDINLGELFDAITYSGFLKMASRYVIFGANEMLKSAVTRLQVKDLQKFVPELKPSDVTRGPAGVRAQALDAKGNLVDDFYFDKGASVLGKRVLHCRNAPSPGATSSLAIAKMMAEKLKTEFQLN